MNRAEHLSLCKKRALEYVDAGDAMQAMTSMMSDLEKHPQTAGHPGSKIGFQLMMIGSLSGLDEVRHFINGFN